MTNKQIAVQIFRTIWKEMIRHFPADKRQLGDEKQVAGRQIMIANVLIFALEQIRAKAQKTAEPPIF